MEGTNPNPPFKRVAPAGVGDRPRTDAVANVSAEEARIAELLSHQQQLENQNRLLAEQAQQAQQHATESQLQTNHVLAQNRELTQALQASSLASRSALEEATQLRALQQAGPQLVQQGGGAIAPQPGAGAGAVELPEHQKIKKIIDGLIEKSVKKIERAQKEVNEAKAAKAGLQASTIDLENPGAPLPQGVPNKVKLLQSPKLAVTKEMALDDACVTALTAR